VSEDQKQPCPQCGATGRFPRPDGEGRQHYDTATGSRFYEAPCDRCDGTGFVAKIERRWTLQGSGEVVTGYHNITVSGPQIPVGERVEVVLASRLKGAVALDDVILAVLDKRAAIHNTDRAGYLRWVLTGKDRL
jgi:RecJ-like exonuclease